MILRVMILDETNKGLSILTLSEQDIAVTMNAGETSRTLSPKLRAQLTEKILEAFDLAAKDVKFPFEPTTPKQIIENQAKRSNVIPFRMRR